VQNAHRRWITKGVVMEESKRLRASCTLLLALFVAAPTLAAPFDEKLKVPRAASLQALRTKFEAHFATFERKRQEADPAAFIRDRLAHRQWSDLYFAVKLAADEKTPLKGLEAYGVVARPDGGYTVDLREYPQWEPLDARLSLLDDPAIVEAYVPALRARGFREEDISTLRTYVATHDPRQMTYAHGRELVDTFAKRLQAQRQAKQRLNLQEVLVFRYQKESLKAEAARLWALGLLDVLDLQRQRILVSFLEEFESQLAFGAASGSLEQELQEEVQPIISGAYVQMMQTDETRLRQEMELRTEKLMEGDRR
jgi:hypothetical protein